MPKSIRDSKSGELKGKKQKPSAKPQQRSENQIEVTLANAPVVAVGFLQKIAAQNDVLIKQNSEMISILKGVKDE